MSDYMSHMETQQDENNRVKRAVKETITLLQLADYLDASRHMALQVVWAEVRNFIARWYPKEVESVQFRLGYANKRDETPNMISDATGFRRNASGRLETVDHIVRASDYLDAKREYPNDTEEEHKYHAGIVAEAEFKDELEEMNWIIEYRVLDFNRNTPPAVRAEWYGAVFGVVNGQHK